MTCSYCGRPLPDDDTSVPNVHVQNRRGTAIMLSLHAECVDEVRKGLDLCHNLVTN